MVYIRLLAVMLMRHFVYVILLLGSYNLFGQQLKSMVITYPKSKDVKEVFFVLAADNTIKHGDYYSFYKGELTKKELKSKDLNSETLGFKEKGRYQNNLRHGDWIVYKSPIQSNSVSIYGAKLEEGQYTEDKKSGIWKTYIEDGKVIRQFDFDNNQELPAQVKVRWRYPMQARMKGIEGLVRIKITYENCEPVDYQILTDLGYGCGDAVIASLKEKKMLEKKYKLANINCGKTEETIDAQFKLDR